VNVLKPAVTVFPLMVHSTVGAGLALLATQRYVTDRSSLTLFSPMILTSSGGTVNKIILNVLLQFKLKLYNNNNNDNNDGLKVDHRAEF